MLRWFIAILQLFLFYYFLFCFYYGWLDSPQQQLNTFYTGLAMAICCIYYELTRTRLLEDLPNSKISGWPANFLAAFLLVYSFVGLNFNSNYALIIGGSQPRIESSSIFFRLPWESYSLHHDNPGGSESKEVDFN